MVEVPRWIRGRFYLPAPAPWQCRRKANQYMSSLEEMSESPADASWQPHVRGSPASRAVAAPSSSHIGRRQTRSVRRASSTRRGRRRPEPAHPAAEGRANPAWTVTTATDRRWWRGGKGPCTFERESYYRGDYKSIWVDCPNCNAKRIDEKPPDRVLFNKSPRRHPHNKSRPGTSAIRASIASIP